MALVESLRLMVLTDAALLKGRDVVDVCRRADAGAPLGPPGFAALASRAPNGIPVIGIGGITAANAAAIVAAGAAGVAVTAAVFGASDPEAAARALRSACDAPPRSPPGARGR